MYDASKRNFKNEQQKYRSKLADSGKVEISIIISVEAAERLKAFANGESRNKTIERIIMEHVALKDIINSTAPDLFLEFPPLIPSPDPLP